MYIFIYYVLCVSVLYIHQRVSHVCMYILEHTVMASTMWRIMFDFFILHQLGVLIPLSTHLAPREGELHLQVSHPHFEYRGQDSGTQERNAMYCIESYTYTGRKYV